MDSNPADHHRFRPRSTGCDAGGRQLSQSPPGPAQPCRACAGHRIELCRATVRSLRLKLADGTPCPPPTREKLAWVAQAAGDRYPDLEFNVYPSGWPPVLTNDLSGEVAAVIAALRKQTGVELSERDVLDSPHLFIGSTDRLAEKFEQLRADWGINSFMVGQLGELEPVVAKLAGT